MSANANQSIFQRDRTILKPSLPSPNEQPIFGLKSNKNYIISNAVNNILSTPKVVQQPIDWTQKKSFGKVPDYLSQRKEQIRAEYELLKNLRQSEVQQAEDKKIVQLDQDQIDKLKQQMMVKYDEVNREYQKLTHLQKLDTLPKLRKKQECEQILQQIEKDMEKLNRKFIFVDHTK